MNFFPKLFKREFFGGQRRNDTSGGPRFRIRAECRGASKARLGMTNEISSRGTESVQLRCAPRKPVTREQNIPETRLYATIARRRIYPRDARECGWTS